MALSGDVLSGDQVVLSGVQVNIQPVKGPLRGFTGSFIIPAGHFLAPGKYRLVLSDGRSGDIVISRLSSGSHQATVAYFQTSGVFQ
jgi:hypothetical protein